MLILIVDDIAKNREILERYLKTQSYDVISASSGRESIEIINQQEIDLVLMDIKMPDMDGFEATRQIKELQSDSYLPVIFVTALSEEEALQEALASGGDDYVTKPISFYTLKSKINAHSRIRELHTKVNAQKNELTQHNYRLNREHELISHFFDQARKNCLYDEDIIKSISIPMSTFNGDTVLVGRRPNGGVTILVGDFTGHGLAAAVGTLPVSQIFFQMVEDNAFVGDIARELNRQINILLPIEMFFAVSLIELSAKGDRLMVWHGGMPDAYLYNEKTKELITIKSKHLAIGIREQEDFDDSVQLFYVDANNKFIVLTDGLSEAENTERVMIDKEVYEKAIVESNNDVLNSVINSYQRYSEGVPQADDISILELSCLPLEGVDHESIQVDLDPTVPWEINLTVNDHMLLKDVVQNIVDLIGNAVALKEHKGVVSTLLAEMYNNALDHGILNLQSDEKSGDNAFHEYYEDRQKKLKELNGAQIKIKLSYCLNDNTAELKVVMQHNGNPFDLSDNNVSDEDFYGRGMLLINAICEEVEYSDEGRCLVVNYQL
ncbi:MAG: response regulator [Gammaproteobacteria bacterium]|nr:response regulator [Gammaproteobacteria bacterium]